MADTNHHENLLELFMGRSFQRLELSIQLEAGLGVKATKRGYGGRLAAYQHCFEPSRHEKHEKS